MALLTSRTLATGVTGTDLIHIVITGDTSQNPAGSSYKAKISQVFDALSGYCVADMYVTNLHSCSPLNINPADEGNVYFGSTSGISLDLTNVRVGIGTSTPSEKLEVSGKTKTTNFQLTSGASTNYVLVSSDNSGNTQWKNINTLTKSWGSFISTVNQTIAVAGTTYKMSANTTTGASNVTLSGGSRFVVSNAGVYNIQFSAQLNKTTATKSTLWVWLSKNGTPVPDSNTEVYLQGGTSERDVLAWNWVDEAATPNTYYEIEWTSNQTNTFLDYQLSPTYGPAIPSLIVTLTQV